MRYKNSPSLKSEKNENQLIELKWLVEPSQLKQTIFKLFQVFVKNSIQVFQVLKWFSSRFSSTKNQFNYYQVSQVFQVSAGHPARRSGSRSEANSSCCPRSDAWSHFE